MDTSETIPTDGQTPNGQQAQKRGWVTPTFEQVALKDALNTVESINPTDGSANSS